MSGVTRASSCLAREWHAPPPVSTGDGWLWVRAHWIGTRALLTLAGKYIWLAGTYGCHEVEECPI